MVRIAANLAFKQLRHRGAKLAAALLGICVAIVLMFTQLGFRNALYDSAVRIARALDGEIFITSATFHSWGDAPPWLARNLVYEAASVEGVQSARSLYASAIQIASPRDGHAMGASLLAFPPHAPVFRNEDFAAVLPQIAVSDQLLIDKKSRADYQRIVERVQSQGQDAITIINSTASLQKTARISGLFSIGPSFTIDGVVIGSELTFNRLTGIPLDRVGLGVVKIAPGANAETVRAAIAAKIGTRARVFLKQEFIDNEINFYASETPVGTIFNLGLLVGVIVGIVFISQALHGIVNDNLREYAALRAIGYPQKFFILLVSIVSGAISLLAYGPSVLASWGFYHLAANATNLPLQLKFGSILGVLVVVLAMGQVATLFAIKRLRSANPVDLFG